MADVWIGRKRWTCKYCNVTINDDVPSRQHHESGLRHKHNVERSLRGLYKENSLKRREEEQHAREIAQIEQAAQASHRAQDARDQPRVKIRPMAPEPKAWTPSDKMATYTTAKSLGVSDEDEAAWQQKFARRKEAAKVGEWETVDPVPESTAASDDEEPAAAVEPAPLRTERDAAREFQLQERTLPDDGDDELPEVVTKRPRVDVKKEPGEGVKQEPEDAAGDAAASGAAERRAAGDAAADVAAPLLSTVKPDPDAAEPGAGSAALDSMASDGLFRKRKARGGSTKKVASSAFS